MNAKTCRALNAINRNFYAEIADEFSGTRRDPWMGWGRAVGHLPRPTEAPLKVLDLGCGNGRFASFLAGHLGPTMHYLGIDSSPAMLEHALLAHPNNSRISFEHLDFLPDSGGIQLPEGPFDLIVLFGVLHHVPGFETRRKLMVELVERLAEGGTLIVAAWQFALAPRFQSRILPWEQYAENGRIPIDLDELESGDFLLAWRDSTYPRYCHFVDLQELDSLFAGGGTVSLDRYTADGKSGDLNLYAVERQKS